MKSIDISQYDVEISYGENDTTLDEPIRYLSSILNDRSIPENQKQLVRKQFSEIVRIKTISMKPPIVTLVPKK